MAWKFTPRPSPLLSVSDILDGSCDVFLLPKQLVLVQVVAIDASCEAATGRIGGHEELIAAFGNKHVNDGFARIAKRCQRFGWEITVR